MQKFKEFDVLYSKVQDRALVDLGIDKADEDYLDKGTIDLNEIESYCKCADSFEGMEIMSVRLRSGDIWSIQYCYNEFKKIL
jgi:hypothetical protein